MLIMALTMLASTAHLPRLTDQQVATIGARPFDPSAGTNRSKVLGLHRGMRLVVEYRCSDLCPANTVRIIHYDHPPGATCERAGGVTRMKMVPVAIAVAPQPFCVPAPLAKGATR